MPAPTDQLLNAQADAAAREDLRLSAFSRTPVADSLVRLALEQLVEAAVPSLVADREDGYFDENPTETVDDWFDAWVREQRR